MSKWFRWYAGTVEDGKFRYVTRNARVTLPTVIALWVALLEDASHDDHRGVVTRNEDFFAAILDLEDGVAERILQAMQDVGMVSVGHGAITITNWNERQFESDSSDGTNAERQRRFREKKKPKSPKEDVTSVTPLRNGTVTAQNTDTDTDTDTEEVTPLPPVGAVKVEKSLPKFGRLEALEAFNAYNAIALRCALPQAAKLTPDRARRIIARLKDYGLGGWHKALSNIESSKFLTGGTEVGFRADLDFICQAKSFGKLHDGGYGNGRHSQFAPKKSSATFSMPRDETAWEAEKERIAMEIAGMQ